FRYICASCEPGVPTSPVCPTARPAGAAGRSGRGPRAIVATGRGVHTHLSARHRSDPIPASTRSYGWTRGPVRNCLRVVTTSRPIEGIGAAAGRSGAILAAFRPGCPAFLACEGNAMPVRSQPVRSQPVRSQPVRSQPSLGVLTATIAGAAIALACCSSAATLVAARPAKVDLTNTSWSGPCVGAGLGPYTFDFGAGNSDGGTVRVTFPDATTVRTAQYTLQSDDSGHT